MSVESYDAKIAFSKAYEEMIASRNNCRDARSKYNLDYHAFLKGVLSRCGILDKVVLIVTKGKELMGEFQIDEELYSIKPYAIKFHPVTKSGSVSLNSRHIPEFQQWDEISLEEQLNRLVVRVVRDA